MSDTALVFVKDYAEDHSSRFFVKNADGYREVSVQELSALEVRLICHDFWLIRDELRAHGRIPPNIFDVDEVSAAISQQRNIKEQRDQQTVALKIPPEIISSEKLKAYLDVFHKKAAIDLSVLEMACDALLTFSGHLIDLATRNGEIERLLQVEMPVFNVMMRHSAEGICVDADKVRAFREDAQFEFYSKLKKFADEFNVQPEVMSEGHLRDYLGAQGFSDDEVSLDYIIEFLPIAGDFGEKLINLREIWATLRTLNDLSLSSERIFPIVDCFGTRTSRIIYRSPHIQNISKKFREVITSSPGKRLAYVDYDQFDDQFEVGIMAALSRDESMIGLYQSGDMYELFAKEFLGVTDFRKHSKRLFLSYAYGMSRKAVVDAAVELGVPRMNAKSAFGRFRRYEQWKSELELEFDRKGISGTVLGNYIVGEGRAPFNRKEKRSMVSQCVQGTGSLIFKRAILELNEIKDLRIVLTMHDAVLFEYSDEGTLASSVDVMKGVMTKTLGASVGGKASVSNFFE